jgi:hypothetical protein
MELFFKSRIAASLPLIFREQRIFEYFANVDLTMTWAIMERIMVGTTRTKK